MRLIVTITNEDGEVLERETFLTREGEAVNPAAASMIDNLGRIWDQPHEEE